MFQNQILDALNTSSETLVPSQYPEVVEGYKAIYQTLATQFLPDIAQVEMLMSVMSAGTVTIQAALQHPFSAGRVYITSTNPFDPIVIDPQYYSHFAGTQHFVLRRSLWDTHVFWADVIIMRQGLKLVRDVGVAFSTAFGDEVTPGPTVQTDDDIDAWLVQNGANTQYHPTASCAMLPLAQGGVVDSNLLVHGLGASISSSIFRCS